MAKKEFLAVFSEKISEKPKKKSMKNEKKYFFQNWYEAFTTCKIGICKKNGQKRVLGGVFWGVSIFV